MKSTLLKRGILAGAVLLGAGGGLVAAAPAYASNTQISAAGSNTIQDVTDSLFPSSTLNSIHAGATSGGIAADSASCAGGITYSTGNPAPNGSTAGKAALAAEESAAPTAQGCIDVARSSSPPSSTDWHGFEYYTFGLDGVAPVVGSHAGGTAANPISLTLAQVENIYNCTITDWHSINPSAPVGSTIARYWPQAGSGTRSLYQSVLGFDPTVITGSGQHCSTAPTLIEENETTQIAASDRSNAMFIYSAGQWATQQNGNTPPATALSMASITTGSTSNKFVDFNSSTGVYSVDTSTVTEANEFYTHPGSTTIIPGIRYVYFVIDNQLPTYATAKSLVGFSNVSGGSTSRLCSGALASKITAGGFVALDTSNPNGHNAAGSHCREFPTGNP